MRLLSRCKAREPAPLSQSQKKLAGALTLPSNHVPSSARLQPCWHYMTPLLSLCLPSAAFVRHTRTHAPDTSSHFTRCTDGARVSPASTARCLGHYALHARSRAFRSNPRPVRLRAPCVDALGAQAINVPCHPMLSVTTTLFLEGARPSCSSGSKLARRSNQTKIPDDPGPYLLSCVCLAR